MVQLVRMRLSNFQSFGPVPAMVDFERITYLLGPNGAGKTSLLTAVARMFAVDPSLRRIQRSDFHAPAHEKLDGRLDFRTLWVEVDFTFPELHDETSFAGVASFFVQMRINAEGEPPRVRIRLTATLDDLGDIEEKLVFVTAVGDDDEPLESTSLDRYERAAIQVHYLPARRDPAQHIAYTGNALLGRLLRAVDWRGERKTVEDLTGLLSDCLAGNPAISALGEQLAGNWQRLHRGTFFTKPAVSFTGSDLEALLRDLNITFDLAPGDGPLDWTRLSDGQQSMLYLTMVLALHDLGTKVRAQEIETVDPAKFKPASFTLILLEEPENSLSPHYLGRVTKLLADFARQPDAQAIIATHSPSVVRRVSPEAIRHLRLGADRETVVARIEMPNKTTDAYKFVREAVEAFPELYFARLVVLGEGDSEEIVLPRMLQAAGEFPDLACISVVPLGGRHVNHFWRLLSGLDIPYVTLLDLDMARHGGGWGRIRYACNQIREHRGDRLTEGSRGLNPSEMPKWDDPNELILESVQGKQCLTWLESCGVYYSSPLDLDFAMMSAYPSAYRVEETKNADPTDDVLTSVLGEKRALEQQYTHDQLTMFGEYHRMFNNGSKPACHLGALASLTDKELISAMPEPMGRLLEGIKIKLAGLPE